MFNLSSSNRSISCSQVSREIGNPTTSAEGQDPYEDIIELANNIPLIDVLKHFNVKLNEFNFATCPFHKNGNEKSPSFRYYPETNSFRCYGCHKGGKYAHATEFLSFKEGIDRETAASKILQLFRSSKIITYANYQDSIEQLNIMMQFSNYVRNFRLNFNNDNDFEYIEYICCVFDKFNQKYQLTNEALRKLMNSLIENINDYIKSK